MNQFIAKGWTKRGCGFIAQMVNHQAIALPEPHLLDS